MSNLYTGIGDVLGPGAPGLGDFFFQRNYERIRIAQVLDVILDSSSPYYTSEIGFGVIRFRFIPEHSRRPEEYINFFAFPIDRTSYTIPLPGECVLIYPSFVGNKLTYMYGQIVQLSVNNAYNVQPFASTTANKIEIDTLDVAVDEKELALRFEKKLQMPVDTYTTNAPYVRLLREGDSIIENRFGSSVYFSSTQEKNIIQSVFKTPYIGKDELQKSLTSEDGDPIVILQANKRDNNSSETVVPVVPSINDDMSSIYLTSTQVIPMRIACSKAMYTWNIDLVRKGLSTTSDPVTFLSSFFPEKYDPNTIFTLNLTANFSVGETYGGPIDPSSFKGGTKESNIKMFIQLLQAAGVTNRFAILGALGTIGKESGFIPKNEKGYSTTDNARIRKIFGARITNRFPSKEKGDAGDLALEAFKKDDVAFFDLVYGREATRYLGWETGNTQVGDGYRYRGRGFNQITFRALYEKYGKVIGQDLVNNPDALNDPMFAAQAAVKFCLNGLKGLKKDPNSFTNLQDAVYYCVRANHGGGEVRGTEGHIKAQKIAEALSNSGLI